MIFFLIVDKICLKLKMMKPSFNEQIAGTIEKTSANLATVDKNGFANVIDEFIETKYCGATKKLMKDVKMRNALFENEEFLREVFKYLVAEHPYSLASIDVKLEKDTEKWTQIRENALDELKKIIEPKPVAGVWSAKANASVKQPIESGAKSNLQIPKSNVAKTTKSTPHTINSLIKKYGKSVFSKHNSDGVSCVGFLYKIYGIEGRHCAGNCCYQHTFHYDFGTPFKFSFVQGKTYTYYYRFIEPNKPIIFQVPLESQHMFRSGRSENIPIGKLIDPKNAPADLKNNSHGKSLEKYIK